MDAFDQLAWIAANDVLNVEKNTPGQQDRAILMAAEQVLRMLAHTAQSSSAPPESAVPVLATGDSCDVPGTL
jgi:hypothetical protein